MSKILVDVDLTVAPSDKLWIKWLQDRYGCVKTPLTDYNLANYYPGKDAYSFWKDLDYFEMQPLEGSVEALDYLSNWHDIVFVSAEKCGYSSLNKKSWLKHHFPFMKGYVQTEEKWVLDSEDVKYIIDDRMDNLEYFPTQKRILFKTHWKQKVECPVTHVYESWLK